MICAAVSGVMVISVRPLSTSISHTKSGMREQRHAAAAHGERRGENIDGRAQRAEAAHDERQRPVIGVVAGRECFGGERRVGQPAHVGRVAHAVKTETAEEAVVEQQAAKGGEPEAERVQARKGHIARADHQRNQVIAHPEQNRHAHQEHHGGAVHGEQFVVDFRREKVIVRDSKLNADGHRLGSGHQQEKERVHNVQDAKLLVIDRHHPAMQPLQKRCAARGESCRANRVSEMFGRPSRRPLSARW